MNRSVRRFGAYSDSFAFHWVRGQLGRHGRKRLIAVAVGISVRRQVFWDNRLIELTEAIVHQGYHFMLPPLGEASGVV